MQIRIVAKAAGVRPRGLPLGIAFQNLFIISFRAAASLPPQQLQVNISTEFGSGRNWVYTRLETGWRELDRTKHDWLCNPESLVGKEVEVEVVSTSIGHGKADFRITLIEPTGENSTVLNHMGVDTYGFSIDGMRIRGQLKRSPLQDAKLIGLCAS